MSTSMLYTMGTALGRAAEDGLTVSMLVGVLDRGQVAAYDGTGVVMECADGQHCVAKIERISAVTVEAASPYSSAAPSRSAVSLGATLGMPMPMPRQVPSPAYG